MKFNLSKYIVASIFLLSAASLSASEVQPSNGQYGEAAPKDLSAQAISAAVSNPIDEKTAGVYSGRVGQVCQTEGCWMILTEGDLMVRVKTEHRFVIPKDSSGNATVYGYLQAKQLDAETAEHYNKESGEGAPAKVGKEFQIDALGIAISQK